jgi:hypothetical protein
MSELCRCCRERRLHPRARKKYCWYCYAHIFADEVKLGRLPADHPFLLARAARVQAMIARADKGLPLFD